MDKRLHRMIRRRMKVISETDNMPICCKRGGRNELANVIAQCGLNRCAEVGVNTGAYSLVLCEANPDIELTCIDSWTSNRRYKLATRKLGKYNVRFIRKTSLDALEDIEDESLDFVYLDANHTFDFIMPEIIFYSKKVRSGGIVAGHDYFNFHWAGVIDAVNAYTKSHDIRPWYVTFEQMPTWFWEKP